MRPLRTTPRGGDRRSSFADRGRGDLMRAGVRGCLMGLLLSACLASSGGAIAWERRLPSPGVGETTVPPDAARTAFQVDGAAGTLEMPHSAVGGRLPVVLVLHDSLGMDGRSDAYAAQMLGAGIAVLDLAVADAAGIGAALEALALNPRVDVGRIGIVGFGAGARLAAALPFPFAARALLYPGCADLSGPPVQSVEVLLMHGGADPTNTTEACARVARRFETVGLRVRQRIFAGATYAWDYPPFGVGAPTLLPAAGAEARVRVRPWPELVALSAAELAGFFASALTAGAP